MTGPRPDPIEQSVRKALSGTYRVERELARGAMARIFLARDLRHERTVAVKVLPPELASAAAAERFLREIRITARLQHPNILPLLDSGAGEGLCWYVMPLVEGESLRAKISNAGRLPIREAVRIAITVCNGLGYAHERGIVHRDIKPENILFSGGQPMVTDLGLARAVAGSLGASITATGLPLGTPAYMSPEQATGKKVIDHRADLYGVGCILYEMVVGQPPFPGRSVMDVIRQHLEVRPTPMRTHRPEVPEKLDRVVARLLEKNPDDRYQSTAEVAQDLELVGALETLGGTAERPSIAAAEPVPAGGVPSPRSRLPLIAGGALVLVAALLAALLFLRPDSGASLDGIRAGVLTLEAGQDPAAVAFAEDLRDQMVTTLVARGAGIPSPLSTQALLGRGLTIQALGDSLNVAYVFHGRVIRTGEQLRVFVELVDASADAALWASSWERPLTDATALRDEVIRGAASALSEAVRRTP